MGDKKFVPSITPVLILGYGTIKYPLIKQVQSNNCLNNVKQILALSEGKDVHI